MGDVQTIHWLSAVDVDGRYHHVRCRRCGEEYPSITSAAKVPCPGPKETEPCPR